MRILVTGAAGFIGFHLVKRLASQGNVEIVGIDNLNDYYDVNLKYARLQEAGITKEVIRYNMPVVSSVHPGYTFYQLDLTDAEALAALFESRGFDYVVNLAAQAGVRYSITHPQSYIQSNIVGFTNILECCRYHQIRHLVYASSSSVYGMNNETPFSEEDNVDYPVSFYAATKRSNELMAFTYSHLFRLPVTGVRLFTVYGPWGRPDMAPMLFANAIEKGEGIKVFNYGKMLRDFTYVDDIVCGIAALLDKAPDEQSRPSFYQLFNIGNSHPVPLLDFIHELENRLGKKAEMELCPLPLGDVTATYADTSKLEATINYKPSTTLEEGISRFVDWYKSYFKE